MGLSLVEATSKNPSIDIQVEVDDVLIVDIHLRTYLIIILVAKQIIRNECKAREERWMKLRDSIVEDHRLIGDVLVQYVTCDLQRDRILDFLRYRRVFLGEEWPNSR